MKILNYLRSIENHKLLTIINALILLTILLIYGDINAKYEKIILNDVSPSQVITQTKEVSTNNQKFQIPEDFQIKQLKPLQYFERNDIFCKMKVQQEERQRKIEEENFQRSLREYEEEQERLKQKLIRDALDRIGKKLDKYYEDTNSDSTEIVMRPSNPSNPTSVKNAKTVTNLVNRARGDVVSRGSVRGRDIGIHTATAYVATPSEPSTSKMVLPDSRVTVATDPDVIPYFTRMMIVDVETGEILRDTAVSHDCGRLIKGNKIDLFFDSEEEARIFGKRKVKIYVY